MTNAPQARASKSLFDGYENKEAASPIKASNPSINYMKCPSCGADIETNSKKCSYCGASITYSMRREQEQVNKEGCPNCSSSNIQFRRENQGEVHKKNGKRIIHRTVGFCKDCGYTWYPSGANNAPQKNNLIWWILGWVFFFPAPVMVLIWRKKNTWSTKVKIEFTIVFWLIFFAISAFNDNSEKSVKETPSSIESTMDVKETKQNTVKAESNDIADSSNANSSSADDSSKEKTTQEPAPEPIEMNSLQKLFVSINSDMTREEVDTYIKENGLVKFAFTHDSAYYIGYDGSAIRQRGRDREGEAVDINFVTSGDPDRIGMINSAEYANHTESSTHYALKFEDNQFYYEGNPCTNGEEAMQKYLHEQGQ